MKIWPGTFIAHCMMTMRYIMMFCKEHQQTTCTSKGFPSCVPYQFVGVLGVKSLDPVDVKLLGTSGKNPSKQPSNLNFNCSNCDVTFLDVTPKKKSDVYCSFSHVLPIYTGLIWVPFKKPRFQGGLGDDLYHWSIAGAQSGGFFGEVIWSWL